MCHTFTKIHSSSSGFFESIIIQNNENDISCHSFTQLDDTSLIGAYTLIATTLETNCIYIDDQIIHQMRNLLKESLYKNYT